MRPEFKSEWVSEKEIEIGKRVRAIYSACDRVTTEGASFSVPAKDKTRARNFL